MAEGFARLYGSDVLQAWSAGVAPAPIIQPSTVKVMGQKNIDISAHSTKSIHEFELNDFDLIVNMSGLGKLPVGLQTEVLTWNVPDPMTQSEEVYIQVREQIESLVMQLILDLRRKLKNASASAFAPSPLRIGPRTAPPVVNPAKTGETSQRFGFGRVRRARD